VIYQDIHVFVVPAAERIDLAVAIRDALPLGHRIIAVATLPAPDGTQYPGVCVTLVTEPA
jgi:hypothetical protein